VSTLSHPMLEAPVFEGFGPEKLIFILLIMVLIFGAKRLPEIGSSLGKGIREFKKSVRGDTEGAAPQPPPVQAPVPPPQLQAAPVATAAQVAPVQRTETTQA